MYDKGLETLKLIKRSDRFEFMNPGILKLTIKDISSLKIQNQEIWMHERDLVG